MATLQKLRDKGSKLLIGFVGIALLAFVAGDIVKLFQKTPTPQAVTVGSINGEEITYDQFYQFRQQCEKYFEVASGNILDEEITKRAWNELAKSKILANHANQNGLAISEEDLNERILNENWTAWNNNAMLNDKIVMLPMFIAEDGKFNEAALKEIKEFIEEFNGQELDAQTAQMYTYGSNILAAWNFFKTAYKNTLIEEKLQASSAEEFNKIKALYSKADKAYDIVYTVQEVLPGEKELNKISAKFNGYAEDLKKDSADIAAVARRSNSYYDGYLWTGGSNRFGFYLKDVKSCADGEVSILGQNRANNTYGLVHTVRREMIPETIKFRYIAIQNESADSVAATTEKLFAQLNAIEFDTVAKGHVSKTVEFNTDFFAQQGDFAGISPAIQKQVYTAETGVFNIIEANPNLKFIVQVMEKNGQVEAYDALVIESKINISNETYQNKHNELVQTVAGCKDIEDFKEKTNATEATVGTNDANINGVTGTRELLKWVLSGKNDGKFSKVFKFSRGNKKYLMVVGVKGANTSEQNTTVVNRVYEHM